PRDSKRPRNHRDCKAAVPCQQRDSEPDAARGRAGTRSGERPCRVTGPVTSHLAPKIFFRTACRVFEGFVEWFSRGLQAPHPESPGEPFPVPSPLPHSVHRRSIMFGAVSPSIRKKTATLGHKLSARPRRPHKARPVLEILEDRIVPFKMPIHVDITTQALSFLRDDVLKDIVDAHFHQDVVGALDADKHFDNCQFLEGAREINANYAQALQAADPQHFRPAGFSIDDDVADAFGKVLHAAQDFYAHSNWVETWQAAGMAADQTPLLETGRGAWDPLL